jgi:hypothetical protein
MAILLMGTGILLGMTPLAVEDCPGTLNQMHIYYCPVRYGLCFLSSATLAAMLLLRDLVFSQPRPPRQSPEWKWRRLWLSGLRLLTCLVLAGAILFQFHWAGQRLHIVWIDDLLLGGDLLLVGLVWLLLEATWPRLLPRLSGVLLLAALSAWVWACALLSDGWHQEFIPHYVQRMDAFVGLHELDQKGARPHTILVLQARCYAFFGSHRQHRVYQPVYVSSPEWLMEFLDKEKVNFVVANPTEPTIGMMRFRGFDECRARHPTRFHAVAETGQRGNWGTVMVEVVPHSEESRVTTGGQQ